jgi:hypothetical protein
MNKPLPTVSGGSGPPDHWSEYKRIDNLTSSQVQDILNNQAALGNTTVLYVPCTDGGFLFFGNYNKS